MRDLMLGWGAEVLSPCTLANTGFHPAASIRFVLLHPELGVALLDLAPDHVPDAVPRFRAQYHAVRPNQRTAGEPPVVYCSLAERDLWRLNLLLDAALATEPPLTAGDRAWMDLAWAACNPEPSRPTLGPELTNQQARRPTHPVLVRPVHATQSSGACEPTATAMSDAARPPRRLVQHAARWAALLLAAFGGTVAHRLPAWDGSSSAGLPALAQAAAGPGRVPEPAASPDVELLGTLMRRADALFATGDVSAARLLYQRAAATGNAAAATALGRTFDPVVLAALDVRGIRPEPATAMSWYFRAAVLGDPEAEMVARRLAPVQGGEDVKQQAR